MQGMESTLGEFRIFRLYCAIWCWQNFRSVLWLWQSVSISAEMRGWALIYIMSRELDRIQEQTTSTAETYEKAEPR